MTVSRVAGGSGSCSMRCNVYKSAKRRSERAGDGEQKLSSSAPSRGEGEPLRFNETFGFCGRKLLRKDKKINGPQMSMI